MEKLITFNLHFFSIAFFYSPSLLLSLTLHGTLIWVRSKIFKYWKYIFVMQSHKEEARARAGAVQWEAQRKSELN